MPRGIQVPVTIGFDRHKAIGTLRVDADQLPIGGDYFFSIRGKVTPRNGIKKFEIEEISILLDSDVQKVLDAKKPKEVPGGRR